jgi:hypothetical protein
MTAFTKVNSSHLENGKVISHDYPGENSELRAAILGTMGIFFSDN